MIHILGVLLLCIGAAIAADRLCIVIDGKLKQVDAGAGQVYGVNDNDDIYQLVGHGWKYIPGKLMHVTVGPAGVWGVNKMQEIFKFQDNNWVQVSGRLKQIDSGGDKFLSGANGLDDIYCVNQDQTISNSVNIAYNNVEGRLKYYTCGRWGCWGVNAYDDIFYRYDVQPTACQGSRWQQIDGKLEMVEVGTDGSVYGVNSQGQVYKREGISVGNPIGTSWTLLNFYDTFQHVSYDQGNLWLITNKGVIYKCKVNGSTNPNCY
ncbi:fish-egg lectin-like [Phyllobates terribilis]|uniref:fish-egg lectin-like n=1 Tax=Phyllobates terribilis TaxID=111132 RepID=UPI003CCAEC5B